MRIIGKPTSRVEGVAKVTGKAKFAAEFAVKNPAHGFMVTATIAKGKISAIDTKEAEKQVGVLKVFTHLNMPKLAFSDKKDKDQVAPDGAPFRALQSDQIFFSHQPIALVVAETYEQARFAASLVKVKYAEEKSVTKLESVKNQAFPESPADKAAKMRGNPNDALAKSAVKIEAEYTIPVEHHNPIEPMATIAVWEGNKLMVFDKTQWVYNVRGHLASIFGIPEADVNVISPFVGGAFGGALRPSPNVMLSAMAARELKRPVKISVTRRQMFFSTGYRPETWQKVSLGADKDGKLTAIIHEVLGNTSTYETYSEGTPDASRSMYACANVHTDYKLAKLDLATPLYMRAPGAVSGMFAFESAIDELAYKLKMDPLEFRLKNYAETDPDNGKPFSSKALRECYKEAAEKFGWKNRKPEPRSMREGNWLIGYGMASAVWGAFQAPAAVEITLKADGTALVRSAASDMGPGTYTVITMIAAEFLGLPMEKVKFELGNTEMPFAPVHGGSLTTASVGSATQGAANAIIKKLLTFAEKENEAFKGATFESVTVENGKISLKSDASKNVTISELFGKNNLTEIKENFFSTPSAERNKYSIASHGAQFVEVKVDEMLGIVRVTRIIEATAAGKIMNPKAAHSQEMGGAVWGIGMALHEETEIDNRYGRMMNPNFGGYHIPVNADVYSVETLFVEEDDKIVNPLGVKGMGELGMVGIPAAIANAVFNATGKRIRNLPITPDKLI